MLTMLINIIFPQTIRTVAELPKHQFMAYRAFTQGNRVLRGSR